MKNFLFLCLLVAGCQSTNKQHSKDQQTSVTINGREYTDSVSVDSAGNRVRIKSDAGRVGVSVSGSGNTVDVN